MALRIVSVNIERSKHLDRMRAFLDAQRPDAICMQELMEYDVPYFEQVGGPCLFTPATRHPAEDRPGIMGTGIFSRLPVVASAEQYYLGSRDAIFDFDFTNAQTKHATETRAVAYCDIEKDGAVFRVGTTHFTWTPDGSPDDLQRADLKNLLGVLEGLGEFVLAGDFNAPRVYHSEPGEIFSLLAAKYVDNIPLEYETSIDGSIHRAGPLPYMVDGLFSTPGYAVSDVTLHAGVSDHMAITATVAVSAPAAQAELS